jgi:hypothetical protein
LATDIFDKELNELRKHQWTKAFAAKEDEVSEDYQAGLKVTIVIEHMIQPSDV